MDSDTKKKIREMIASLDCMKPGLPRSICPYYKACKAIMAWYYSLNPVNTKENEE